MDQPPHSFFPIEPTISSGRQRSRRNSPAQMPYLSTQGVTNLPTHPHTQAPSMAQANGRIFPESEADQSNLPFSNDHPMSNTQRQLLDNWWSRAWVQRQTQPPVSSAVSAESLQNRLTRSMSNEDVRRQMERYLSFHGAQDSASPAISLRSSSIPELSPMLHSQTFSSSPTNTGTPALQSQGEHVTIQISPDRPIENTPLNSTGAENQPPAQVPGQGEQPMQHQQIDEMAELRPFILWIAQGTPLIVLMAFLFVYTHFTGISIFGLFLYLFLKIDRFIRHQVSLKADRSLQHCLLIASLLCTTFLLIQIFCIDENRVMVIFLGIPSKHDLFSSLWSFVMNDFILTNICMFTKIVFVMSFGTRFSHRRSGQILSCVEGLFRLVKIAAPIPIWSTYLSGHYDDTMFTQAVSILYPILKVYDLGIRVNLYAINVKKFVEDEHYGDYVRADEIADEERTCPICHDTDMSRPIMLRCRHVFCEDCIAQWFENNPTCPICRAVVRTSTTKAHTDGSTSVFMQIF